MAGRTKLYERYELGEVLGRGGMGVVYKAHDTLMDREVALKTILDIDNPLTLELFYKECGILAAMVHPNIINVYDVGEFEDNGVKKPFFVMPLLPGATLDRAIKDTRITVENVIEIMTQACRGLQAAHEMGLVHRDVKPSNIFVMEDHSVKIIDFGVARAASMGSMTGLKGTLAYMAPEQLQYKPPSPLSDQYALAMVCYEALARRRPFQVHSESEMVDAILRQTPPPISDFNPNIKLAICQVVHKALAKQPLNRFANVREFGDALNKALRSETIDYFDPSRIKPRLERATASFGQGDYEFASEILSELESEGFLDPDISLLRRRLDQTMRQARVRQLLESANRYLQAQEYPLALRKIQEAIEIDPEHPDTLSLKNRVEKERRERKMDEWMQLARQHVQNQSFRQAREALDNALKLRPNDTEALRMQAEITRREQDITTNREKKQQLYESALQMWDRGDVTSALGRMDMLVAMEREAPDTDSGRGSSYQSFYNQVRSEHDNLKHSYEEARQRLAAEDFEGALALCKQFLTKYPNHALFHSLEFDVEERRRQKLSAFIAETDRRADQEPDLDVRVALLEEAARLYPEEKHFQSSLRLVKDKRDLVSSIVGKAQLYEERQQFHEALDQWQILKSIHAGYPGLNFEIERMMKRRDAQSREGEKARLVEQIDRFIEVGEYDRASHILEGALTDFPNDPEFPELEKLVRKSRERTSQALDLVALGREAGETGTLDDSLPLLRQAHELDPRNAVVRAVLINTLLEHANRLVNRDWQAAEPLLREVLELEPNHAAAQSLLNQSADRQREEFVTACVTKARRLQIEGDLDGALALVRAGLENYPREKLLLQLEATLERGKGGDPTSATRAPATAAPPSAKLPAAGKPAPPSAESEAMTMPLAAVPPQAMHDAETTAGHLPPRPAEADATATVMLPPRTPTPTPTSPSAASVTPSRAKWDERMQKYRERMEPHHENVANADTAAPETPAPPSAVQPPVPPQLPPATPVPDEEEIRTMAAEVRSLLLANDLDSATRVFEASKLKHGDNPRLRDVEQELKEAAAEKQRRQAFRLDENVQFTVSRPVAVQPGKWYWLLAFAHLSERRSDASPHEPDPVEEVNRQIASVLGDEAARHIEVTADSDQAVPRDGQLTFVPEIPGIEFNPPRQTFLWKESVHREEFRMRAAAELEGTVARGHLTVFLGSIIIGDIALSIRVSASEEPREVKETVVPYRKIFASYSHRDVAIVEECERYARAVGDEYVRDMLHLRTGEVWGERLRQMIEDADIFQLFWSENAMRSGFVRQEWEYALALVNKRQAFIRPVYWEEPLPADANQNLPPEKLRRFHFQRLPISSADAPQSRIPEPVSKLPNKRENQVKPKREAIAKKERGRAEREAEQRAVRAKQDERTQKYREGIQPPQESAPSAALDPQAAPVPPPAAGIPTAPPVPPATPPIAVEPQIPPPQPQSARHSSKTPLLAVAGVALLVVAGGVFMLLRGGKKQSPPAVGQQPKITVRASQPQASILVDDKPCGTGTCEISLAPGPHRVEARLEGFAPVTSMLDIKPGDNPAPVDLILTARLPTVVIATNLNQATIAVDQGADQPIQNGEVQLTDLAAGERIIHFKGEGSQATIAVTMSPSTAPRVAIPIQQQNLGATIVSGMGAAAKVFTTLQNGEASLDGKPAGKVSASGLDLTNLAPGSHEVVVTVGQGSSHRVVFDSGPVPAMAVFLGTEKNRGLLRVTTGEDDVTVYINGDKTRRGTRKGWMAVYLPPKTYTIRVEKDGFQKTAEQTVEVKKGEEARVEFQMVRLPLVGSLLVQKAPAGAEVAIDGAPAGTVHPDRTLSLGGLKPGSHTLAVKKDSYKPLTREINVVAGQQIEVDATLQPLNGTVKVTISPADVSASFAWRREGDETTQPFSGTGVALPEGSYTILGHAADYEDAKTTVKVVAGREAAAELVFKKIGKNGKNAKGGNAAKTLSLADVEKAGGWTKESDVLIRTGGNYVLLPGGSAPGTYAFAAMMPKGKRLDWVVSYADPKNYVSYELNDDHLDRLEYVDGKKQNQAKPKLRVKLDQWVQVTVEVTNNSIVTSIQQEGNKFPEIDKFTGPKTNLLQGRFGFRVPNKDKLAVGSFSFAPK